MNSFQLAGLSITGPIRDLPTAYALHADAVHQVILPGKREKQPTLLLASHYLIQLHLANNFFLVNR
jgi:hypothetical protein